MKVPRSFCVFVATPGVLVNLMVDDTTGDPLTSAVIGVANAGGGISSLIRVTHAGLPSLSGTATGNPSLESAKAWKRVVVTPSESFILVPIAVVRFLEHEGRTMSNIS